MTQLTGCRGGCHGQRLPTVYGMPCILITFAVLLQAAAGTIVVQGRRNNFLSSKQTAVAPAPGPAPGPAGAPGAPGAPGGPGAPAGPSAYELAYARYAAYVASLYVPTPQPNLLLMPDYANMQWTWVDTNKVTPAILAAAAQGTSSFGPAPGPGIAPAPGAAGAPGPGPAGGPGGADPCPGLQGAAAGQFTTCKAFAMTSSFGAVGNAPPAGCQCGSLEAACPLATCPVRAAWEENCLAPPAAKLGFTAISRMQQALPPGSLTICTYWLPPPTYPSLPDQPPPPWPDAAYWNNPFGPSPGPAPSPFGPGPAPGPAPAR